MALENLTTESVLKLYENIREQVVADTLAGTQHRLLRETAQKESDRLRAELDRRGVRFLPINWP